MNDPEIAASRRMSSPEALAGLFDAYADRLFLYCWRRLRNREIAQIALRDTFVAAQAHIARMAGSEDPGTLGPWLYSLARGMRPAPGDPDVVRALPHSGGLRGRRPRRAREDHPVDGLLPRQVHQPDGPGAGALRAVRRRGPGAAEGPGHAARRGAQDGERGARQRLRHPRHHRGHALRAAGPQVRLDHGPRPGEGRGAGGHAHPAQGLDRPVAADDLARPAGLPFAASRLRRVRSGPLVPLLRRGAHRPEGGREARQARPVLVTPGREPALSKSAGPDSVPPNPAVPGSAPSWLLRLADAAGTMEVPALLAPPATGGRPSAVLVLFGDGPDGPDLLFIQRSDELRLHAGQPAFPGGAIDDGDGGPVGAALREATEEVGLDPGGVDVVGTLPEVFIERTGFRVVP